MGGKKPMKMKKSFFNRLTISLEHKYGKDSEKVLFFELMYIAHCQNPYGKIKWKDLYGYWVKNIK